jgi:uncharacterized membrane protein HdeD (DUF308 family)
VAQRLSKSWSLLAVCGILDALFAAVILFMWSPDGFATLRSFVHGRSAIEQLGLLALVAGVCAIAAGIWNSKQAASWFLALEWSGVQCTRNHGDARSEQTRQVSNHSTADRRDGGEHRRL